MESRSAMPPLSTGMPPMPSMSHSGIMPHPPVPSHSVQPPMPSQSGIPRPPIKYIHSDAFRPISSSGKLV